jgi:hypothetical protein
MTACAAGRPPGERPGPGRAPPRARLRRDRLDAAITELAQQPEFAPVVNRLMCLRGVSTLTAVGLAVEIGDWHRLSGANIGAYLGLTPTESQSGARHTRGSITKAGNRHARRLLVEAAWHHRRPHRASIELERRRAACQPEVRARAELAGRRLHQRWNHLNTHRGLRSTIVAIAIARELAGWCWSLAIMTTNHSPPRSSTRGSPERLGIGRLTPREVTRDRPMSSPNTGHARS